MGVILALQADDGIPLGVDNLGVVQHVGRLLDGKTASQPLELVKDGDLILFIERMLRLQGLDTVRTSEVKGDRAFLPGPAWACWYLGCGMGRCCCDSSYLP